MEHPTVQFVTTSDGIDVAYIEVGSGPPVVFASNVWGDATGYALPHPHTRRMTDELCRRGWAVVRHDARGMGFSERNVDDLSIEARVTDLEAVIERLQLKSFALGGVDSGAAAAISYAAANPERVSRLFLLNPWPSGKVRDEASPLSRTIRALQPLADQDWAFISRTVSKLVTEEDDAEHIRQLARSIEKSASPRAFLQIQEAILRADLKPLLASLGMPVLVVHDTGFPFGSFDSCRQVASGIAGARLLTVSGDGTEEIEAVDQFLRSTLRDATPARESQSVLSERPGRLTPRELEVLRLIVAGRTNREISDELVLSIRTVARHITNIYAKIGARSKAEATAYAFRNNLA